MAQGSVTAPMPTAERPVASSADLGQPSPARPPSDLLLIPRPVSHEAVQPAKELPSIFAVIDSRRTPEPLRGRLEVVDAAPPRRPPPPADRAPVAAARRPEPDGSAVRADGSAVRVDGSAVRADGSAVRADGSAVRASSADLDAAPVAHAPEPRSPEPVAVRPKRRSASFSEADAAFFAAGEEMERAHEPFVDEEPERAPVKRPTLWRRLTGRR